MKDNFYDILWVSKTVTQEEIKKAYRKKAMEFHPDRNKWNKQSEEKFKKINEAYDTLWDENKRKNYDMFWNNKTNGFWWGNYSNSWWWKPFWWYSSTWWFDFEDFFKNSWWGQSYSYTSWWSWFDFEDFFWWNTKWTQNKQNYEENLDITKIYEVPIFDLILWCKIEVKWYSWETAKLKIPKFTSAWVKFRVSWFGKKIWSQTWNLIVEIKSIMPKSITENDEELLKKISKNIKY